MSRYREVRETLDKDTGELVTSERTFTTRTTTELFSQFFHDHPDFKAVYQVARLRDLHVLLKLCELAEYDTGRVKFGTTERAAVGKLLTMSAPNLSGSLSRLRKLALITGKGSQIQLNPRIFWKGSAKARRETIAAVFPAALPAANS